MAHCKGSQTCTTKHPIATVISFSHLFLTLLLHLLHLLSVPKPYHVALLDPKWKSATDEEMAPHQNQTWELSAFPHWKQVVGCHWVYTIKFLPNGQVERLKSRFVA